MIPAQDPAFCGRRALVTGGSSGIGRAIAEGLIKAGADVAIVSRRAPDTWEGGAPQGWDAERNWVEADLNHTTQVSQAVGAWLERVRGEIDIVVLSAVSYGRGGRHTFLETAFDEWQEIFTVNLHSAFLVTHLVLPALLQRERGLILHLSSEVAFNPGPGRIGYSSSKAAARALFTGLAHELRETPVSVVGLLPEGMVDTPGIRRRRAASFDYHGYSTPDSFVKPALQLVATMGREHHGAMLVVSGDGQSVAWTGQQLISQSR